MNQIKLIRMIVLCCCLTLSTASCKKIAPPVITTNVAPANFSQVFENFWNAMNTNYVYWDVDTTNWDEVYRRFKPVFAKLDLQNKDDLQKSVDYFRKITNGLIDNHYLINFVPQTIIDSVVFPSLDRKKRSGSFHSPFLFISVDSNYLDPGFISGKYLSTGNAEISTLCGTINNKILYFYCNGFALSEAYYSTTNNSVKTTLQFFFNQLHNLPANIKGLIIDVRNNRGGNLTDLDFFVGQLISKPVSFGYTHYKNGNSRLSFTPWISALIYPQTDSKPVTVPIIVMADHYSISLAEAVTMAIRTIPGSIFVGETTWGATGPTTNNAVYNDGPFTIPSFLSVYTSSAAFRYIDGKSYEGIGFPPDIYVSFDFDQLYKGNDTQLNKAISLVP